jgi:hypothetical protein
MTERPDIDTLRLLREVVDEIGTNPAVASGAPLFALKISFGQDGAGASATEPPLPILRHLLDRLRHLDMPSSDVRLDRVFPILDRVGVLPEWVEDLGVAKARYRDGQEVSNIKVQIPGEDPPEMLSHNPTWIRPREAFDLWAYGGVIHHDYAKEQRWAQLNIAQGPVRMMGHEYAMMLLEQAEWMSRLLRFGLQQPLPE